MRSCYPAGIDEKKKEGRAETIEALRSCVVQQQSDKRLGCVWDAWSFEAGEVEIQLSQIFWSATVGGRKRLDWIGASMGN